MSTFYTATVCKRKIPDYIAANVTTMYLCKAPLKGDTVAQIAAKAIASAPFTGADMSIADVGEDVVTTFAGKNNLDPSDTSALSDDLVTVYCSATENLIAIDAVDRVVTNDTGDTINVGAATYTIPELTAA